ncbi:hypothetical protein [Streptomyces sp. MBT62]|uniref:hypothetical protein n=1 Tax=Streptomyces sp. MBT62 TaxID=2800410 RepID=UPI00190940FE|nr:hypothetical protein [Streptomyces sp. MBT62]MBK3563354.1 hypothetical protein [Streptomyces sp. MBT62]
MSKLTHRRRSAALAGMAATAALTLLSACGGGSGGDGEAAAKDTGVASIETPKAGGATVSASAAAESGRPQLRLDTSEAEQTRLTGIYFDCLRDHGAPGGYKPGSKQWYPGGGSDKITSAARKACLPKLPLQPPELDPAKNPHYMDDFRAYIRCLNDGGLKVKGLSDGSGWNYDGQSSLTQAQEAKLDHDCQLKAYK